jgi:hypothetical protein
MKPAQNGKQERRGRAVFVDLVVWQSIEGSARHIQELVILSPLKSRNNSTELFHNTFRPIYF